MCGCWEEGFGEGGECEEWGFEDLFLRRLGEGCRVYES